MPRRTLALRKESLAELTPAQLARAAGGTRSVECIAITEGTLCGTTETIIALTNHSACPIFVSLDPDVC